MITGNGTGQNEPDSGSLVDNGTSLIRGLCNRLESNFSKSKNQGTNRYANFEPSVLMEYTKN